MAVLIDPPRWPAHGTVFSHLVSDESLAELHSFARGAAVPPRAFDHDHYDVPARRYDDLVAHGAEPVRETELVRRLLASGLRIRPAHRAPKRPAVLPGLREAWNRTLPNAPALGADLLGHWSQDHREYHDVRHLAFMLDRLQELGEGRPPRTALLAAWFHDGIHTGRPGADEEDSARWATHELTSVIGSGEAEEVSRLVLLTATHAPAPSDATGGLVCDADLAILGTLPGRYDVYVRDVRLEYDHMSEHEWRTGRGAVVANLLARDRIFTTTDGSRLWEDAARANLRREQMSWASQ